ncbi:MAG: hypothetical protein IKP52_02855, partial [Prevotella sp.]|nr:hypothetical protein [Prevotella sp.]
RRLVKWVKAQAEDFTADSWLFCGENTGGYSIGLCNYLYGSGYDMWLGKSGTVLNDPFFVGSILRNMKKDVSLRCWNKNTDSHAKTVSTKKWNWHI